MKHFITMVMSVLLLCGVSFSQNLGFHGVAAQAGLVVPSETGYTAGFALGAKVNMGEIADKLVDIDNANKWGFAHEMGPFEIWDAVGVKDTLTRVEEEGFAVPAWVKEMVAGGFDTFYQRDERGAAVGYYDPNKKAYVMLEQDKRVIVLNTLRAEGKEVERLLHSFICTHFLKRFFGLKNFLSYFFFIYRFFASRYKCKYDNHGYN